MASLQDFREKLAQNANRAFTEYVLIIDEMSLDYATGEDGTLVQDEFKVVTVVFEYSGPNVITMRAKRESDEGGRQISYLPWKNAHAGGISQARLTGDGPQYFSTSQLTGCRFTIQYDDASRQTATVLHLAGDVQGEKKPEGSATRDGLEQNALSPQAKPTLKRSYSIGQMKSAKFKEMGVATGTKLYYDGGKAAIFGYRKKSGAWTFYAAEQKFGLGAGLVNLTTLSRV
ncbi:MAG TPA: hypothetical protein VME47_19805 [Acetobacteraceae bacterium]|nr:hypothetical protein [Acetobacteraceae bacterium]